MELKGQTAVVTGAANGIGAAVALALAEAGADIAAVDLAETDLGPLQATGRKVAAYRCDVTDSAAVDETCSRILKQFGTPAILVNDAGGAGPTPVREVEDLTDETWHAVMDLNVKSIISFCRALTPSMKAARYGRIVNLSSTVRTGIFGPLNTLNARIPYVTAKSAIVGLTKQLSKDLAAHGVTVNAVAPGLILPGENSRIARKFRELPAETQERITASIPAGRLGTAEDVAAVVRFFVSPGAGYVSGETLNVSGAL